VFSAPQIAKAKLPAGKPYLKVADRQERGLYLYITPTAKIWRLRAYRDGRETTRSLGEYPAVSLAQARDLRDGMKRDMKAGEGTFAPPPKSTPTLRVATKEWFDNQHLRASYAEIMWHRLDKFLLSAIGDMQVTDVRPQHIVDVLKPMADRPGKNPAEIPLRLCKVLVSVYSDIVPGMVDDFDSNPAMLALPRIGKAKKGGHRPAIVDLEEARAMLRKVESMTLTHPVARLATRLQALTALRSSELLHGHWSELDGITWHVPGERMGLRGMKMGKPHEVPLSRQAMDALRVLRQLAGDNELMFPSQNGPLTDKGLWRVIERAGYAKQHCPHGWRSTFSTNMNRLHPRDWRIIDQMLAHEPKSEVEKAYNREDHMIQRRELAQEWADMLLDGFPEAREVVWP
jgi:integrase